MNNKEEIKESSFIKIETEGSIIKNLLGPNSIQKTTETLTSVAENLCNLFSLARDLAAIQAQIDHAIKSASLYAIFRPSENREKVTYALIEFIKGIKEINMLFRIVTGDSFFNIGWAVAILFIIILLAQPVKVSPNDSLLRDKIKDELTLNSMEIDELNTCLLESKIFLFRMEDFKKHVQAIITKSK